MPDSLPPPSEIQAVAFAYFGVLADATPSLGDAATAAMAEPVLAKALAAGTPEGQDWTQLLPVVGYALDQRVDDALDNECHPDPAATAVYETLLQTSGVSPSDETVVGVVDVFGQLEATGPHDGAVDVIHALRDTGLMIGVIANCVMPGRYLRTRLSESGLEHAIDALLLASEWGWTMPHPSTFREMVERLECAPEHVLFVCGDWRTEVRGAEAVGLRTVWVRSDLPERVEQVDHSYVIRDLDILLDWFAGDI